MGRVRTKGGTVLRRGAGGVGKQMGQALYLHRRYAPADALALAPYDFEFTVVKITPEAVSFILCPDFDTEPEPAIQMAYRVEKRTGHITHRKIGGKQIYHHKWMFVAPNYDGFDVAASVERSRAWLALDGVDMSRIGSRAYWEEHVLPRLENA